MDNILLPNHLKMWKINVGEVPALVIRPEDEREKYSTIVWYHGWSSQKENQVFRASILASYGYQVVLPDAKHHGERGSLDYEDKEVARKYLVKCVLDNIDEFTCLHNYILKNLNSDGDKIALSGHSMGAVTAGGIFSLYKEIKLAALFNGTFNWQWVIDEATEHREDYYREHKKMYNEALDLNPMSHIENMVDRPIIMLNGEGDSSINPKSQEAFYNYVVKQYKDKSLIAYNEYPDTNHVVTTSMMSDAVEFIKKFM